MSKPFDFKVACAQLEQLHQERSGLLITLKETENDDVYEKANQRITAIHKEIEELIVNYVRETHNVSTEQANLAMAILDEQDRKHEAIENWIYDERPPVNESRLTPHLFCPTGDPLGFGF